MKQFVYKVVAPIRKLYWWLVRPTSQGVRAIVMNKQGDEVLLVRHSYVAGWFLPGGAMKHGEAPEDALKRELEEETGVRATAVQQLGVYTSEYEYKRDTIHVFVVSEYETTGAFEKGEIVQVRFFKTAALPNGISQGAARRIQEWCFHAPQTSKW